MAGQRIVLQRRARSKRKLIARQPCAASRPRMNRENRPLETCHRVGHDMPYAAVDGASPCAHARAGIGCLGTSAVANPTRPAAADPDRNARQRDPAGRRAARASGHAADQHSARQNAASGQNARADRGKAQSACGGCGCRRCRRPLRSPSRRTSARQVPRPPRPRSPPTLILNYSLAPMGRG